MLQLQVEHNLLFTSSFRRYTSSKNLVFTQKEQIKKSDYFLLKIITFYSLYSCSIATIIRLPTLCLLRVLLRYFQQIWLFQHR